MARYFMHLRGGTGQRLDPEGREFSSHMALRNAVLFAARDLVSREVCEGAAFDLGFWVDAEDESGAVIHTLTLKHAVSFIPESHRKPGVGTA